MPAASTSSIQSVKNTGFSAFEELRRNQQSWEALGFGKTQTQLSAMSGANSIIETSRQLQQLTQGPALAFDRSFEVAVKPVSLQFENAFATAVKPIIDQQAWSLAEMVRLSLPSSFLDTVRALEFSAIGRIQELSRVALVGPSFQTFKPPQLDWTRQMSGFDFLVNAVQAAGIAAREDIAVPGEPPLELPEWLTDFADRVRALPRSERRALVFNLLAIIVATASLFVTGPAAHWMRASSVALAAIGYVNRLSAMYENDEDEDQPDDEE
jgi:hypothetical protein